MSNPRCRWSWLAAPLAVASVALPGASLGQPCPFVPPPSPLATVPSDGDVDVPLDAQIWALVGYGPHAEVRLVGGGQSGTVLSGTAVGGGWMRFSPPALSSGEQIAFEVVFRDGDGLFGGDVTYGPYSFTVGGSTALAPLSPAPGGLSLGGGPGACADWLDDAQCAGEGEWTTAFADVSAPAEVALWHVRVPGAVNLGEHWLPAGCPPGAKVAAHSTDSLCIEVRAVAASGAESGPATYCVGGSGEPGGFFGGGGAGSSAPGGAGSAPDRGGPLGCRSAGGDASSLALAFALALALRLPRRSRS